MDSSKLKPLIFFAIFLLFSLYVKTSMGRPTTNLSRGLPTFLRQLYNKMMNSSSDFPLQTVHGIFARVKPSHGGVKHSSSVTLLASFAFASLSFKKTTKADLHVSLESRATNSSSAAAVKLQQHVQAVCKLHIDDVKTNKEISSKRISCTRSSTHVVTLTSFVNKWLKSTSNVLAVRVRISSNTTDIPTAILPFINSSSHVEQPYYILYV